MLDPRSSNFWRAAIRSSLMDDEKLAACWDAIEPAKRDDPEHIDRRLAQRAVRAKWLTLWQAQQLLAGRISGYMVDRYQLLDLLGEGGMGRVYLARDTRLDRLVALKILSAARMSNPRAVARFQREARTGAQLQHENLVRIYDSGESHGRYFLVMEYIEGKTVATLMAEWGPAPPATAARLARQVALGLEHAHRKGLIHRDVNPFNILVTHDGTAKLADMGLAIALDDEERVTRDGATVGTFDYVAPEQAKDSRAADIRSDIYSLGCTLYHMCSGRVPFPAPSLPEKLLGHQTIEPAPLSQMVPGIPEGLSEIVRRMMRKSPAERYATSLEVARALEPYQDALAGAGGRAGEPPILMPLDAGPAPVIGDVAQRHPSERAAARTGAAAMSGGRESSGGVAPHLDPRPYAADSDAPILMPDDDFEESADEVRLILDPDPELSSGGGESQSGPSSARDDRSADSAAGRPGWLTPSWLWAFVVLAVMMIVLLLVLAMA
jgi:eukaryotic-like serine/threonine-protein kinase